MIYLIKTVIAIKNASFLYIYIYIKTMNAVQVSINPPKYCPPSLLLAQQNCLFMHNQNHLLSAQTGNWSMFLLWNSARSLIEHHSSGCWRHPAWLHGDS